MVQKHYYCLYSLILASLFLISVTACIGHQGTKEDTANIPTSDNMYEILDRDLSAYRVYNNGAKIEDLWESERDWYLEKICESLNIDFKVLEYGEFFRDGEIIPTKFYIERKNIKMTFTGEIVTDESGNGSVEYTSLEDTVKINMYYWRTRIRVNLIELLDQLDINYTFDDAQKLIIIE
jgi:hypothetical protein